MTAGRNDGPIVLVPGAWMGAWVWDDTVQRLVDLGHRATALTLVGLEPDTPREVAAAVTLDDHVNHVLDFMNREHMDSVVLVGHSYSGVVVGQVADRASNAVRRSVHIASFLPRDGRSMLDDWGPSAEARQDEKDQVRDDGMLWAPPPGPALEAESDLTPEHRRLLASRFVDHPGRTVLDPAKLSRPVTDQPVTFIASAATGSDPLGDLPPELQDGVPPRWQVRSMSGGHWPMLTNPDELVAHLDEAATTSVTGR